MLNTESLDVTNETLVSLEKTSNQSVSSGNAATINWDTEVTDITNSYDMTNDEFNPLEDGYYVFRGAISINGASDQGTVLTRLDEVGGSLLKLIQWPMSGTETASIAFVMYGDLTSGTPVEVKAGSATDSTTIQGNAVRTFMLIERVVLG